MMTDFFKELFDYTLQFNSQVLAELKLVEQKPEKALNLINHTLSAHEIWNSRILGINPVVLPWDVRAFDMLEDINLSNYTQTIEILNTYDLEKVISYTNTKGVPFENKVRDILFHAANHSTYHRGQIATDFKLNGMQPIVSDYIFYKR